MVCFEYFEFAANNARGPRGYRKTGAAGILAWVDICGRLVRKELPLTVFDWFLIWLELAIRQEVGGPDLARVISQAESMVLPTVETSDGVVVLTLFPALGGLAEHADPKTDEASILRPEGVFGLG